MPFHFIPERLIDACAAEAFDLRSYVEELVFRGDSPLSRDVETALNDIPAATLEEVQAHPVVAGWITNWSASPGSKLARMEVLIHLLDRETYTRRRTALLSGNQPYQHPALADLQPDRNNLVALSHFSCDRSALERRGYAFIPTPPVHPVNSHFWSSAVLFRLSPAATFVRLDPLLVVPSSLFRPMFYSMYVYGRDLNWRRLAALRGVEHAQWIPDNADASDIQHTDIVWRRRDDGVHFECEEVPKCASERPARYFHAILDSSRLTFIHSDAAVRFYDEHELNERKTCHLKDLGKVGIRVKLFRVDEPLDTITWSTLVAGAFVWNRDLQQYFRGQREN